MHRLFEPRHAAILATGSYLPETEITNEDLARRFPPKQAGEPGVIDKFHQATGIRRRWYAPDNWATSDLAVRAARQALDLAGRKPEEVDLILLGTDSPDFVTPSTSVVVQHKLGATNAGAFDIGCACASFPTALATAAGWIATNPAIETVLVVGAYLMHRHADPDDPTIFFYGDGAGVGTIQRPARLVDGEQQRVTRAQHPDLGTRDESSRGEFLAQSRIIRFDGDHEGAVAAGEHRQRSHGR